MPRKYSSEVRLYCVKCKDYAQSIEPVIIKKDANNRFHIKALCFICNKFKTKFLNLEQVKTLPDEIKNSVDGSIFKNTIERNGGLIPIIPLIGAIAMGISALASAAGTTASVVLANKQANETERHNKQIEQIAGNGISNKGIKIDELISDKALPVKKIITDDELINQSMKFLRGKGFLICI